MAAKVAMFVFNNLDHDARVHRQAEALAQAGHQVRIYAFFSPPCRAHERFSAGYEVFRLDHRSSLDRSWSEWFPRRPKPVTEVARPLDLPSSAPVRRPCPPPLPRHLPLHSSPQRRSHRSFVRQVNREWWRAACPWKPDLCQAHDLDALWAAQATSLSCGAALLYDCHEIWSEQHFLADREEIVFWNQWEARLAPSVDGWITVNRSLAQVFSARYGAEVLPVHNCPRRQALQLDRRGRLKEQFEGRPVALFSGSFQASRGLEEMVAAAMLQKEVALVLQGFGPQEAGLRRLAEQYRSPVTFLPKVPYAQLTEMCCQADIGVMPALPDCLNSYYCSPNKIFDYMMAGLPVVATDLPEMAALVEQCHNGLLYDAFSPQDLARALVELAHHPERAQMAQNSRFWAENTYNWETESLKLLGLVEQLLERRRNGPLRVKTWVDPHSPGR
jgi:glycosyltransferase involved in cell wall biosynthesis